MKKLLTLALAINALHAHAEEEDYSKIEFKVTRLTPAMAMLEGAGGNVTALTGPEGTLLVDDDFAPMAAKLLAKLQELGGASPKYIFNTHFHYDHSGGNEIFGASATVIAAAAVRERLMTEQTLWREKHPPLKPEGWPKLTFEGELTIHLNGERIQARHLTHGHTDGDTVVFFEKNRVVSMGDLYFAGMYPIFHTEHAGSLEGFASNIAKVIELTPPDAKIVPGHGPLSSRAELVRYHQMIRASIETVRNAKRSGRTLEQIQKAGLAKEWDAFAHGYLTTDQWLALVYKGL